jgi:hypothetical protein
MVAPLRGLTVPARRDAYGYHASIEAPRVETIARRQPRRPRDPHGVISDLPLEGIGGAPDGVRLEAGEDASTSS